MLNFKLVVCDTWRRNSSKETYNEPRPHVVPLNEDAEWFLYWEGNSPRGDCFTNWFLSPTCCAFGTALVDGRWTEVFRLQSIWTDHIQEYLLKWEASFHTFKIKQGLSTGGK